MRNLRQAHPIMKYPLVSRLSKASLSSIVLMFIAATLALVVGVAALVTVTSRPHQGFGSAFRYSLANVWNPGDLLEKSDQNILFYLAATLDALGGVLLPTFLLGAFVFKLFQYDPLVWRRTVSVENLDGRPILRFRFYNATRSSIVRVEVVVYARVRL